MNEEFSGRGPGTRARKNRGVGALAGVWEMGEERRVMGVLKGWKVGEIGGNYPALLKICHPKMAK